MGARRLLGTCVESLLELCVIQAGWFLYWGRSGAFLPILPVLQLHFRWPEVVNNSSSACLSMEPQASGERSCRPSTIKEPVDNGCSSCRGGNSYRVKRDTRFLLLTRPRFHASRQLWRHATSILSILRTLCLCVLSCVCVCV